MENGAERFLENALDAEVQLFNPAIEATEIATANPATRTFFPVLDFGLGEDFFPIIIRK